MKSTMTMKPKVMTKAIPKKPMISRSPAPSTSAKAMAGAMANAARTNTLGVGFGGEPRSVIKKK